MSDLKIEAKVIEIQEVKSGTSAGGKEWSNQTFVVETDERYPKTTALQASGKLLEDVKRLSVGQKVTVFFDVVSRKHEEKWYTQANAWKIEGVGAQAQNATATTTATTMESAPTSANNEPDLPF